MGYKVEDPTLGILLALTLKDKSSDLDKKTKKNEND